MDDADDSDSVNNLIQIIYRRSLLFHTMADCAFSYVHIHMRR